MSGVRYLGISGRAPGGSHLLSYLGLGRGGEGGWGGRTQGILQGASQGLPWPCSTLFTAETSLLGWIQPDTLETCSLLGGSQLLFQNRSAPPNPEPWGSSRETGL